MREQIRYSGSRHVEDIAANSRMLVEKALYMRCQSYLAHVKSQLLTQTIFEVEDSRKKLKRSNMALRDTVQELAASRARLQAIFDNKLVGLLITNVDGGCLQANARAAEILGRSVSELCGGEFKLPVELRAGKEIRERLLHDHLLGHRMEQRISRGDDEPVWVDMSVTALRDEHDVDMFLLVLTDITEQKNAEQIRATLEEQLRRSQKLEALGTLAGGVAHDFNNVLTAIVGLVGLVREHVIPGSEGHAYLEEILGGARRAGELVRQILRFSRQAPSKRHLVDSVRLTEETLGLLRASIPKTIEIRKNLSPSAGAVFADPTGLQQVLLNLGANAAYAMRAHGGVLTVQVDRCDVKERGGMGASLSPPGSYVRILMSDTGTGIPPDVIHRIFDPYFSTKPTGEGSGLGLAVAHGIITSLGGSIRVESEVNKGTRFEILLPRMDSEPIPAPVKSVPSPRGSERILIVDDEPLIALSVGQFLRALGYNVTVTTKAEDGLRQALNMQFDLVLSDQTMPLMTGIELARRLQQLPMRPKFVLMTGNEAMVDEATAHDAGIMLLLSKPMELGELAVAVRRLLDGA